MLSFRLRICKIGIVPKFMRCISKFKKRIYRENVIHTVHSSEYLQRTRAYVFGNSGTGALGLEKVLLPKSPFKHFVFIFTDSGDTIIQGVYSPTNLNELNKLRLEPLDVACGYGYTIFICKNFQRRLKFYGCGVNTDGQLGYQSHSVKGIYKSGESIDLVSIPTVIDLNVNDNDLKDFSPSHLACGRAHTLVAFNPKAELESLSPVVFSFGNNVFGQCGREVILGEHFNENSSVVIKVALPSEIKGIKQLVCGQDHSLLLSTDGHLYSCGLGSDGQHGLGTYDFVDRFSLIRGALEGQYITQISSRGDTSLALTATNRLFAWGNNEYGQIWPIDDELQVSRPVELDLDRCYVPPESELDPNDIRIGRIVSIACAGSMCAILNDVGQIFVWGFGCIGLGPLVTSVQHPTLIPPSFFASPESDTSVRPISITAGLHHFVVRNAFGNLWAWGAPRGGIYCLGLGKQTNKRETNQSYPLPILMPTKAFAVACGVDHTVVLTKSFFN